MFVLSAGMPKSGSAYFYNVINSLVAETGGRDAREIKSQWRLEKLMKWYNNNVDLLSLTDLTKLWIISLISGKFTVKTHAKPNQVMKTGNSLNIYKVIYCYRDPRDAILSAIDHGKRISAKGETHTFAAIKDYNDAIILAKRWIDVWDNYKQMPNSLSLSYEYMIDNPISTTKKIEDFLDISVTDECRNSILWKYNKNNVNQLSDIMHLNKARTNRYKTEMPESIQQKCLNEFGSSIKEMGYET